MHPQDLFARAGINLKPQHYEDVSNLNDDQIWFEVHTENYFVDGGARIQALHQIAERYPLSFHGVGASLGNPMNNFKEHLGKIAHLVNTFSPALISEHATWSGNQDRYFADLLPIPKTNVALQRLCNGVDAYQNAIGRSILLENPTNYLDFLTEMDEADFLIEVSQQTGCGLLLDVNNLYLSHQNCGLDIDAYMTKIPKHMVGEIHIAGFDLDVNFPNQLWIDSHDSPVSESVWRLLEQALEYFGSVPVLLERDDNIPAFSELYDEVQRAQTMLKKHSQLRISDKRVILNERR